MEKAKGGKRPLGVPTIKDRVVQTAAMLVIEPIFEAGLPSEQHGYRLRRSAQEAVRSPRSRRLVIPALAPTRYENLQIIRATAKSLPRLSVPFFVV